MRVASGGAALQDWEALAGCEISGLHLLFRHWQRCLAPIRKGAREGGRRSLIFE